MKTGDVARSSVDGCDQTNVREALEGSRGGAVRALAAHMPRAAAPTLGWVGSGANRQQQKLPPKFRISREVFNDRFFANLTLGEFLLRHSVVSEYLQPVQNVRGQQKSIANLFGIDDQDLQNLVRQYFEEITPVEKEKILYSMRINYLKESHSIQEDVSDDFLINEYAPNLVGSALNKKIDASAANMVFVKTEKNTYLIVVYNQKKGVLLQASNGAAKNDESLCDAAYRHFLIEFFLGGMENNTFVKAVQDEAVHILTQNGGVGENCIILISRILQRRSIYINASATRLVEMKDDDFHKTIEKINSRLSQVSNFYKKASECFDNLPFFYFEDNISFDQSFRDSAIKRFDAAKSLVTNFLGSCYQEIPEAMRNSVFRGFDVKEMAFNLNNLKILANVIKNGIMQLTQNTLVSAVPEESFQDLLKAVNSRKGYGEPDTYFFAGTGFFEWYLNMALERDLSISDVLMSFKEESSADPILKITG